MTGSISKCLQATNVAETIITVYHGIENNVEMLVTIISTFPQCFQKTCPRVLKSQDCVINFESHYF